MLFNGAREDNLFEVASFFYKVVDGIFMGDTHDVLLDDGTGIEFGGHVVTCGTNELHTAFVGFVIRFGSDECGEE